MPSGWSSNFSPSSVNLNSGESTNVNWSVTSDSQAPEDNYGVTAEATDDTEQTFTGSDIANYEVNNSPTVCGDDTCDAGEDCNSCSLDCDSGGGVSCGNGVCEVFDGEDSCSCAADCGVPPANEVGLCSDGVDNDCDGDTDCSDSDCDTDSACSCLPVGSSCSASGDCCSNKCKGKAGAKVCK